jgi:hypothetical protein
MRKSYKGLTLAAVLAGSLCMQASLQASPILYTLNGTFGSATGGDIFQLSGKSFTLTATLDSNAVPTSVNGTADTFTTTADLTSVFPLLGTHTFEDTNATVTLAPPGTIDLSMNIAALGITIPVTASINASLSSSLPMPLVSTGVSGTASYGSGSTITTLNVTGTLSTNPAGTGGGGSNVPEPASVALVLSGLVGLVLAKKKAV